MTLCRYLLLQQREISGCAIFLEVFAGSEATRLVPPPNNMALLITSIILQGVESGTSLSRSFTKEKDRVDGTASVEYLDRVLKIELI
jgi:hypothetical protein